MSNSIFAGSRYKIAVNALLEKYLPAEPGTNPWTTVPERKRPTVPLSLLVMLPLGLAVLPCAEV